MSVHRKTTQSIAESLFYSETQADKGVQLYFLYSFCQAKEGLAQRLPIKLFVNGKSYKYLTSWQDYEVGRQSQKPFEYFN